MLGKSNKALAMKNPKSRLISFILFCSGVCCFSLSAEKSSADLKQLFFEERKIEGKIRRPQLVLIKAEQRPEFDPMVIQSLGRTADIVGSVEKKILDQSPYDDAFRFHNKQITNYVP